MKTNLKELRNKSGLSQEDMANRLGIKTSRYGTWERGERMMSLHQACDICDILECSLDELAGRSNRSKTIDDGERALINDYRKLDLGGKRNLRNTASYMAGTAPSIKKEQEWSLDDKSAV